MSPVVHTGGTETGSGPTVTFLHGAGMDHTVWRFQTRWLAQRGWNVIAPDLPGHGRSGGEPFTTVPEWAEWLAGYLHAAATAPVAVVGHSLGGLVAVEVAARQPGWLERVVLVGAGARMPVHPALMAAAGEDLPRAAAFIAGWSLPPAHTGGHPEPGTWEWGGIYRLVERSRPGVLSADLAASASYDATSRLGDVRVPTLVLRGEADRMVSRAAAGELAAGMAEARSVTIPGAGHQPMVQCPRVFNRHLGGFLGDDGKGCGR
ncbi:MAG: alpha/beta fold hydrolase [Actinomycetota bacterium]